MEVEQLILFLLLALLAEILGTIGGFGSSMFFVPMATWFLDFHSVLGITALFHVTSNLTKIAWFRKGIDWHLILYMGIPAVIFVILGAYLSRFFDAQYLETSLAIVLIGLSLLFLVFPNLKLESGNSNAVLGGGLSGFVAGLVGTGGAIRGIALASFQLGKESFIATSAWIDLGIDFSRSIVYFFNGYLHKDALYIIPGLLLVSIAGTGIGKWLLGYISDNLFRKLVLILILGVGISILLK